MPCHDGREDADRRETQERLDRVTRLLCEANTLLDAGHEARAGHFRSQEMLRWWREHQEKDQKRLAREQAEAEQERIRKQARRKLTPIEQKALGLI